MSNQSTVEEKLAPISELPIELGTQQASALSVDLATSLAVVPVEGLYAIAAALITITLPSIGRWIHSIYYKWCIRKAIKVEFKLMLDSIDELIGLYEEFVEKSSEGIFVNSGSSPLHSVVFDSHYSVVAMSFNMDQRRAHDYIRKFRDEVNQGIGKVRVIADDNQAAASGGVLMQHKVRHWADTIILEYGTAVALKWYLQAVLSNFRRPDLASNSRKVSYTNSLIDADKKIQSLSGKH